MEEEKTGFTSRMANWQYAAVLLYLPAHVFGLPLLLNEGIDRGLVTTGMANFWLHAFGAALMLALLWRFLRRDFDVLCDRPFVLVMEALRCYALLWCVEIALGLLLPVVGLQEDAESNREAVALLRAERGPMLAASVFLAPILEESIFRAGIFGLLRRRSRALAYAVSAFAFSLYHVWSYALADPRQLLYVLEYLPAALLLARCYERTNSVWGSMLLHALSNGVAIWTILRGGA